jgi:hypothetical protein
VYKLLSLVVFVSCATPVTLSPEPPGANCAQGGVGVSNGSDTLFVCNGVQGDKGDRGDPGPQGNEGPAGQDVNVFGETLQGSFDIRNEIDIARFQPVRTITGNLTINMPGLSSVTLPNLETVQGELIISTNPELSSISFPALDTIGIRLIVTQNPSLPTCQAQNLLAQLTNPPPGVIITGNDDAGICP